MQIVILAGGLATRLRPLTLTMPKSMVRILGKPFLEYQLNLLVKQEIRDIVLCTGYLGDQIEEYFGDGSRFGVEIKYSREKDFLLGTAGALKKAELLLKDEFFVMYGDSYLQVDFWQTEKYFHRFKKKALMIVYCNYDQFDKSNVEVEGNLVKVYSKTSKTQNMVYIDYGLLLFKKSVLKFIPAGQAYPLEEILVAMVNQKELLAYEVDKRFYEIGSLKGLQEFEKMIERGDFTK